MRLLTTLAGSLSVALENARLFDETERLLNDTNERAAELAIINSVQQGLAEKLDMQAMYDLVGDKIQEIFDAQVVDIGLYDFENNMTRFPYTIERGVRFPDQPVPISGDGARLHREQKPIVIDDAEKFYASTNGLVVIQGERPQVARVRAADLRRPRFRSDLASEPRSDERLQRSGRFAC